MKNRRVYLVIVDQWLLDKPQRLVYGCHGSFLNARRHAYIVEKQRLHQGMTLGAGLCLSRHDMRRDMKLYNRVTAYRQVMSHSDNRKYDCVEIEAWRIA